MLLIESAAGAHNIQKLPRMSKLNIKIEEVTGVRYGSLKWAEGRRWTAKRVSYIDGSHGWSFFADGVLTAVVMDDTRDLEMSGEIPPAGSVARELLGCVVRNSVNYGTRLIGEPLYWRLGCAARALVDNDDSGRVELTVTRAAAV